MIQKRDHLFEYGEGDFSTINCKVVGHIDWNGFINNFMKETHIIEIKHNIEKWKYINLLTFSYIKFM